MSIMKQIIGTFVALFVNTFLFEF